MSELDLDVLTPPDEEEVEVVNNLKQGVNELPGSSTLQTPSRDEFVNVVRRFGLAEATKAYVQKQEGPGKYTELRNQGLRNIDILPMFVNFEKLDVPIDDYLEQGISRKEAATLLAQDMGVDLNKLKTEDGTDQLDFLQVFAKGRSPSTLISTVEGPARGLTVGVPAAVGMGLAYAGALAAGATTAPVLIPAALIGLIGGGYIGQEIEEAVFPNDPILDPDAAAVIEAGKTGAEVLTGMGLIGGAKKLTEFALKNQGPFAQRLNDSFSKRKFNIEENEVFAGYGANPRMYERLQVEDPVLFKFLKAYEANPKAFLGTELVTGAGATLGAYFAEREYPTQMGPRVTAEILGAGIASPFTSLPYWLAAGQGIKDVVQGVKDLPMAEQEARIGGALVTLMKELNEDPAKIREKLDSGEMDKVLDKLTNEYNANRPLLRQDINIVPTARQITESTTLDYLESRLRSANPRFGLTVQANYDTQVKEVNNLVRMLAMTGDRDALALAGQVRKRFYEDLVERRMEQALSNVQLVADKINPTTLTAKNEASSKIDNILMGAFADIRKQESLLHSKVPVNLEVAQSNLLNSIDEELKDMAPEVANNVFPKMVLATATGSNELLRATALDSQIKYQSDLLSRLDARAQLTGDSTSQKQLDFIKELRNDVTSLEKERARLPEEFQPLTYRQMKNYRSQLLRLARESAAGENPSMADSRLYGVFAKAIERDMHDLETIGGLNNLSQDKLEEIGPIIDQANSFSKAFNDVFRRAFPNQVIRDKSTGAAFVVPEMLYKKIIQGTDDETTLRVKEVDDALTFLVRNSGATTSDLVTTSTRRLTLRKSMDDILRHLAYDKNIVDVDPENPDNFTIDPSALRRFVKQNEQALDMVPSLKSDLEDADTSFQLIRRARERVKGEFKGEAVADFFNEDLFFSIIGEKPYLAFKRILNEENNFTEKQFTNLITRLRRAGMREGKKYEAQRPSGKGPKKFVVEDIDDAIRGAIFEYAVRNSTPGEGFNASLTDYGNMQQIFFDAVNRTPLVTMMQKEGLITAGERLNLSKALNAAKTAKERVASPEFEVEQDLESGMDMMTGMMARIAGSKLGTFVSELIPGRSSGLIEAGVGAGYARKLLNSMPKTLVNDVLEQAIFGPNAKENLDRLLQKGLIYNSKMQRRDNKNLRSWYAKLANRLADVKKLNAFLVPIIGDFTVEKGGVLVPDDFTEERMQEMEQFRNQPSTVPPFRRAETATPIQPPAPPAAPPPQAQAAPPNPQLRQRYAAMYPNDPISGLIEQQAMQTGIGTLPT